MPDAPGGISHRDRARENLSTLFGPAVLGWFDRACRENDTTARIGLCDLAVHDLSRKIILRFGNSHFRG